jgi:hypothetical protein
MIALMYRSISLLLLLLIISDSTDSLSITPAWSTHLHVIPLAVLLNNHSDGSLTHLYSSLQQALDQIEYDSCQTNLYLSCMLLFS